METPPVIEKSNNESVSLPTDGREFGSFESFFNIEPFDNMGENYSWF